MTSRSPGHTPLHPSLLTTTNTLHYPLYSAVFVMYGETAKFIYMLCFPGHDTLVATSIAL